MSTPAEQEMIMRGAVVDAVAQAMRRDSDVFYIGEDVGAAEGVFKQTEGLFTEFGEQRVVDTPISEAGFVGVGIGAAMAGMRPIIEIMFADFMTLILDQLVNHAAKMNYLSLGGFRVPMVLRTAVGIGGVLGSTHSQTFWSWPANVPGLKVVAPSTPADAKGLMASAILDDSPVLFFEDRMLYNKKGPVPTGDHLVEIGKGVIRREGSDVSLIALSRMNHVALDAADKLEQRGISAEVVDPRSIMPLDRDLLIESVAKTGRAVVIDGGHEAYGITGEIAATVAEGAFDYLDAPVVRLGAPHNPIPCNKPLEPFMLPSAEQIVAKVEQMFG